MHAVLEIDEVLSINKFAIGDMMPILTLYFDIEPEEGLRRIKQNEGREVNRLDLENIDFHRGVREGYKQLIKRFPERIHEIDASNSVEMVFEDALKEIMKVL